MLEVGRRRRRRRRRRRLRWFEELKNETHMGMAPMTKSEIWTLPSHGHVPFAFP